MPRSSAGSDSLCLTTLYGFHSLQLVSRTLPAPSMRGATAFPRRGAAFALLEQPRGEPDANAVLLLRVGESAIAYHMSARIRKAVAPRRHAARLRPPTLPRVTSNTSTFMVPARRATTKPKPAP